MSSMTNQSPQKGSGYSKKKFGDATNVNQIATPSRPKGKQGRRHGGHRGHHAEWKQQYQPSKDAVEDTSIDFMQGEKVKKEQLLSDSKEFVCRICCEHVVGAAPVLTRCSHLFCGDCFARWAEVCPVQQSWAQKARKANNSERSVPCPACEEMLDVPRDIDEVSKDTSKSTNLVLWRMLYSVKVCCKNNPQYAGKCGSCDWIGDYGDYQKHVEVCHNMPLANGEEAQKADSVKTTRSGSPASRDAGSSSTDSPQLSPNVSSYFRTARDLSVPEEGMTAKADQQCLDCTHLLQSPPGLDVECMGLLPGDRCIDAADWELEIEAEGLNANFEAGGYGQEEEEEMPEWAEDDVSCASEWAFESDQVSASPLQMPEVSAGDATLQTKPAPRIPPPQWTPRVDNTVAEQASVAEQCVEESELPSNTLGNLMSLLSEIDEDGGDNLQDNEEHGSEENACMGNLMPPDAASAPEAPEKAAKPPPPPAAIAPMLPPPSYAPQMPPPPPSIAPVESVRAPVQLDQLLPAPSQPAPQTTPARTPQVIPARMPPATAHATARDPQMPPAAGHALLPAPGLPPPKAALPPSQGPLKQPVRGNALFNFNPTEPGHIPVQIGEPIEIYEYHVSGWCHCRSLARPAQRSGWVPSWVLPPPRMDAPAPPPMPGVPPMPMPLHAPPPTLAPQLGNPPPPATHAPPAEAFLPAPGLPVPAPGLPPAPAAAGTNLPPPPPGICAPPSEPPSAKMPNELPSAKMPPPPAPTQPVVEVRHAYNSTGPSFLSVAPRDLVEIFRRDASGWAYGRKVGCAGKPEGWFPAWVCAH